MVKVTNVNSTDVSNLQSKLNSLTNNISDRTVSLSAEAHSVKVATIQISCSGIRGTMTKTMVIVKQDLPTIDASGEIKTEWHAYVNGMEYLLASISELQNAIRAQVRLMKPLVQYR